MDLNKTEFLEKEKVGKLIFKLAIPTIIAQIVNLLYNIVDRIYIGHIPNVGSSALTGVGICMSIIIIISAFAALIGYGGAPKTSIYLGQKKQKEAEIVVGNSFVMLIVVGLILTTVFMVFGESLLYAFGASENTIGYAKDYLFIYLIGSIFVMIALGMNSFITAQGYTKISMITILIGAITNCLLDPIFIFEKGTIFHLPIGLGLGVKGAAIATIISQGISALFVTIFLFSKKSILRLSPRNMKIHFKIMLPALALGLSPFIMQFTEAVISVCFNASLKKYGSDLAVGTMTILYSLMQFSMLPIMGLAQGAQPVISYNFGARNTERVKVGFRILFICSIIYSFVLWLFLMLFPEIFAKMFTDNLELINYSKWAIRIYFAVSGLFGIQIACQQTFVAIGKAKISLFLAVLRKIILLIPFIFIFPMIFKDNQVLGVFLAEPVADGIAVMVTGTLFMIFFNKSLRGFKKEKVENSLFN